MITSRRISTITIGMSRTKPQEPKLNHIDSSVSWFAVRVTGLVTCLFIFYLRCDFNWVFCCATALGCKSASQSTEMGKIRVGRGDERESKIYVCKGNVTLGACQRGSSGSSITCSPDVLLLRSAVFSWQHDILKTPHTKHCSSCLWGTEAP